MKHAALLSDLRDIAGAAQVLTEGADMQAYTVDWRRQYRGDAVCVVRPGSTDEVARVVGRCVAAGVAIVPQGGNTGLCGGSVPTGRQPEVVLALARMNRIRAIDVQNNAISVEAGCVLASIQAAAAGVDRLFPLSLGAEGSCQIGGNLSTNAGGVNVLRYGNAREQVLGLEVVLPDGRVWDGLRALRKDNTGYDLKQLFIGAEGTLGIITAAVLRLHPRPRATVTAWCGLGTPADAIALCTDLRRRLGDRVSAFELLPRVCLEAVLAHLPEALDPLPAPHPWYVLAELTDGGGTPALQAMAERAFAAALEQGFVRDVAIAHSQAQAAALWRLRERLPEAQFSNVKHDISVPLSRIPEFIDRCARALGAAFPGVVIYAFGHAGDGNLHYNVGMPDEAANAALMARRDAVNAVVYGVVDALGGSISAEHGLGQLKRDEIRSHKSAVELDLMRALKQAFDPGGLFNPGKVI